MRAPSRASRYCLQDCQRLQPGQDHDRVDVESDARCGGVGDGIDHHSGHIGDLNPPDGYVATREEYTAETWTTTRANHNGASCPNRTSLSPESQVSDESHIRGSSILEVHA